MHTHTTHAVLSLASVCLLFSFLNSFCAAGINNPRVVLSSSFLSIYFHANASAVAWFFVCVSGVFCFSVFSLLACCLLSLFD